MKAESDENALMHRISIGIWISVITHAIIIIITIIMIIMADVMRASQRMVAINTRGGWNWTEENQLKVDVSLLPKVQLQITRPVVQNFTNNIAGSRTCAARTNENVCSNAVLLVCSGFCGRVVCVFVAHATLATLTRHSNTSWWCFVDFWPAVQFCRRRFGRASIAEDWPVAALIY